MQDMRWSNNNFSYHEQSADERAKEYREFWINRKTIFYSLGEYAVRKVEARYNGDGDSGFIEKTDLLDFQGNEIYSCPKHLEDDLDTFLVSLLNMKFAGWECNDGSFGTIHWDLMQDIPNLGHLQIANSERQQTTLDSTVTA